MKQLVETLGAKGVGAVLPLPTPGLASQPLTVIFALMNGGRVGFAYLPKCLLHYTDMSLLRGRNEVKVKL